MKIMYFSTKLLKRKIPWKKGNGTAIIGISVLVLVTALCILAMDIFILQEQRSSLQNAADTIADSTANYMLNSTGTYENALEKANEIKQDIETHIGTEIDYMEIDRAAFADKTIRVRLVQDHSKTPGFLKAIYQVEVTAATRFKRSLPLPSAEEDH